MRRTILKPLKTFAMVGFSIALLFFLGRYIYLRWQEVRQVNVQIQAFPLIISLGLLMGFYLLYSQSWLLLLRWLRSDISSVPQIRLYRLFFSSFITRYLPAGKLLNIGSRIELLQREIGGRAVGAISIFYEQFYLISCAFLIAWFALLDHPFRYTIPWSAQYPVVVIIVGTFLSLLVLLLPAEVLQLTDRFIKLPPLPDLSVRLTTGQRMEYFFRFLFVNIAQGSAVFFMIRSIYSSHQFQLKEFVVIVAAYPLSRVIGQLTAIFPGGLGIREGAFAFILGPILPIQPVVVSASLFRLVSIAIELCILGALIGLGRTDRFNKVRKPPPAQY
jgi:uncharacterized membrane protein YbhN (UPF0104 family)